MRVKEYNPGRYDILKCLMLVNIKPEYYEQALEYVKNNPGDVNGFMVMINGA
jgi:hypothetical protein